MARLWNIAQAVSDRLRDALTLTAPVTWLPISELGALKGVSLWVRPASVSYGDLSQRPRRQCEVSVVIACRLDDAASQHEAIDLAETISDLFVHKRLGDDDSPICHEAAIEVPKDETYRQLQLYVVSSRLTFVVTVR